MGVPITATTRTLRYRGELFISVETIDEIVYNMRKQGTEFWSEEIQTLTTITENARAADRMGR